MVGDSAAVSEEGVPLFEREGADSVEFRPEGFHPHVAVFGVGPDGGEVVGVWVAKDFVGAAHAYFC